MAKLSFGRNIRIYVLFGALAAACFVLGIPAYATTYNVKDFGAKADGVSDDSTAIAKAIATASASPGNTVLFPSSNNGYVIGSAHPKIELNRSVTLQAGYQVSLDLTDPKSQIRITGNGVTINAFYITNNGSQTNSAIVIDGARNCVLNANVTNRMDLADTWSNAVRVNHSTGVKIENNTFNIPYDNTIIRYDETGVLVQNGSQVLLAGNTFRANDYDYGHGYGVYSDGSANNITINSNQFRAIKYGVYAKAGGQAASPTITASKNVSNNCVYPYYCQGVAVLSIDQDTLNSASYGIYAYYNQSLTMTRCTINAPSSYGIYVAGSSSQTTAISKSNIVNVGQRAYGIAILGGKASITNNTVSGPLLAQAGIYSDAPSTTISGNTINGFIDGVQSITSSKLTVQNNQIANCFANGVACYKDGKDTITGNTLSNCGLAGSAPATYAVIYVTCAFDGTYVVTDNTYSATKPDNVYYFVYVYQSTFAAGVTVKNNKTDTMLPSYP